MAAPQWLVPASAFAALAALSFGYAVGGFPAALLLLAAAVFGTIKLHDALLTHELTAKLTQYASMAENIYIVSESPADTSEIARADRERELLQVSQNHLQVQVHVLCFDEGADVGETWEQYQERVAAFIATDRKARHAWMLQKFPDFYRKHVQGKAKYHSPLQTEIA